MNISIKGLDLIKRFEGLKLDAYLCPAKVWTIGYGHTGPDVQKGLCISQERAEELLRDDLMRFEDAVNKAAPPCTQGQFDALVSFAYNVGITALKGSTLLRLHKAGDHKGASVQFHRWVHAGGHRNLPGLVRRRAAESALYLS